MDTSSAINLILGLAGAYFAIVFALLIFVVVLDFCAFKKAGRNGFLCLVPFYAAWVKAEIAFGSKYGWIGLVGTIVGFIPGLPTQLKSAVAVIALWFMMFFYYRSYGLNTAVCVIGLFIPIVPMCIIAFSKNAVYNGGTDPMTLINK